jgi:hypothetical protein
MKSNGGFCGKVFAQAYALFGARAARGVDRPVRLDVLQRRAPNEIGIRMALGAQRRTCCGW